MDGARDTTASPTKQQAAAEEAAPPPGPAPPPGSSPAVMDHPTPPPPASGSAGDGPQQLPPAKQQQQPEAAPPAKQQPEAAPPAKLQPEAASPAKQQPEAPPAKQRPPATAAGGLRLLSGGQLRALPAGLLPAVGTQPGLDERQLEVLAAWYALYAQPEAAAQQALLRTYAPRAAFEDNFVAVSGADSIGVQFYAMMRACRAINVAPEKVEVLRLQPGGGGGSQAGASGVYQLRIITRIAFHLPRAIRGPLTSLVLPDALEAWATDTLTVQEGGSSGCDKVLRHVQRVHNLPVLPWLLRWLLGTGSSLLMVHVLGW